MKSTTTANEHWYKNLRQLTEQNSVEFQIAPIIPSPCSSHSVQLIRNTDKAFHRMSTWHDVALRRQP